MLMKSSGFLNQNRKVQADIKVHVAPGARPAQWSMLIKIDDMTIFLTNASQMIQFTQQLWQQQKNWWSVAGMDSWVLGFVNLPYQGAGTLHLSGSLFNVHHNSN